MRRQLLLGRLARATLIAALVLPVSGCSNGSAFRAGDASSIDGGMPESQPAMGTPLRNVDVTIIYPLPSASELDALLKPADRGAGGALLTADVFDQGKVPELDARDPIADDAARLASLRVIAIRFDPCPGFTAPPPAGATCVPEMRLVFQSLKVDGTATSARDGAIHAFHSQSRTEFDAILGELRDIREASLGDPAVPLDVHPHLREQGPGGAYANRIRALILAHAGPANLVRVTHFRRVDPSPIFPIWQFSLREPVKGSWQDRTIPTTATTQETVRTIVGGRWDAIITPTVANPDDDPTHFFKIPSVEADQRQAFSAVVRALNPRTQSSQSIDCASCHVAPDIAIFLDTTKSFHVANHPERFQSTYPLDAVPKNGEEAVAFQNLHMTSYSGRVLSLASRTVNETAAVLEAVNGDPPP